MLRDSGPSRSVDHDSGSFTKDIGDILEAQLGFSDIFSNEALRRSGEKKSSLWGKHGPPRLDKRQGQSIGTGFQRTPLIVEICLEARVMPEEL
jgi:hypothetical protein